MVGVLALTGSLRAAAPGEEAVVLTGVSSAELVVEDQGLDSPLPPVVVASI